MTIQNKQQSSEIDESDFELWMRHPITFELFEIFKDNRVILEENILNLDPINDMNLDRKNAYLRGSLEICEKLLNLTFDQLFLKQEEVKSDENQETPYSWG